MNYEDLDVYKCMYDLLLMLYERTRRLDRDYRFTLGQDAKRALHEALFRVYMVTTMPVEQQPEHVVNARYFMARFVIHFRLMQSLGQLNEKDVEVMNMAVANVMNQLKKWENYLRSKKAKNAQKEQ